MIGPASMMKELRRASARREFTVVSLFANIGGMEIGAMRAGGVVPLANEINRAAVRIHRNNFPKTVVDDRDARKIAASPDAVAQFLAKGGLAAGEPDCICGGSPCNRLSTLARIHHLAASVPDTRRLLFDFARVIRYAAPLTALGENVAALAVRHPQLLNNVLNAIRFDENGKRCYFASHRILCASQYGTPQVRRRTFFIAVRVDVGETLGITTDEAVVNIFPEPTTLIPPTVRWALQGLHPTAAQIEPFRRAMSRGRVAEIARLLPLEPHDVTRPHNVGLDRHTWFSLERLSWHKPSTTLTARGLLPISLSGPLHPAQHRKLCVPEIMRLFGVPDDFDFGWASASEAVERLGLMVPPPMAFALFEALRDRVVRPYRQARGIDLDAAVAAM